METTDRPWLERLKHHLDAVAVNDANPSNNLVPPTDKTYKTGILRGFAGFVGESDQANEEENTWRVEAFRERIPSRGPIWPPLIRDTADCDAPDRCGLCGDALSTDPAPRFPRCHACVQALEQALLELREGVKAESRHGPVT
jgi:hypothetical protein